MSPLSISSFYIKPQLDGWFRCLHRDCLISSFYIKPQRWRWSVRRAWIVLYRLSTSNHNRGEGYRQLHELSYIVFLHQTTTWCSAIASISDCLISSFYIKPQPFRGSSPRAADCLISSFYIKPQRPLINASASENCLISSFYIKPQQPAKWHKIKINCLISSFYIKPQRRYKNGIEAVHCLISSFYIKPQHVLAHVVLCLIVLYRLSTSNHNRCRL